MEETPLRYDVWVEEALRGVIRRALTWVSENGLPGDHHFYITYRTDADGIEIPSYLKAENPEEMTIVLQHQFSGLEVGPEAFAVTLSFSDLPQRLTIPYAAVVSFADPSVKLCTATVSNW